MWARYLNVQYCCSIQFVKSMTDCGRGFSKRNPTNDNVARRVFFCALKNPYYWCNKLGLWRRMIRFNIFKVNNNPFPYNKRQLYLFHIQFFRQISELRWRSNSSSYSGLRKSGDWFSTSIENWHLSIAGVSTHMSLYKPRPIPLIHISLLPNIKESQPGYIDAHQMREEAYIHRHWIYLIYACARRMVHTWVSHDSIPCSWGERCWYNRERTEFVGWQ